MRQQHAATRAGGAQFSFRTVQLSARLQGDPAAASTWGFIVPLLPFLDKNLLFKSLDLTKPVTDPANAVLPVAPLPFFVAPRT